MKATLAADPQLFFLFQTPTQKGNLLMRMIGLLLALLALTAGMANANELTTLDVPCRILDTRNTAGGFTNTVDFIVRGSPGAVQGGEAACGVPYSAVDVFIRIIAVGPQTPGHVILKPYDTGPVGVSNMNFPAHQTTSALSLVRLQSGAGYELSLSSSTPAYWIADIQGWTESSTATLVGQAESFTGADLHVRTFSGVLVTVAPPLTPSFYNSWSGQVSGATGKCVHVDGVWTGANTFEARSMPFAASGYCGPS